MLSKELLIAPGASNKSRRPFTETVMEFFVANAQVWRFPPAFLLFIWILPFLLLISGALTALLGKSAYLWFTGEDGLAENLQIAFNVFALLLALLVIRRYRQIGATFIVVLYLILCCGFIFLIGEEISWGQRIFGWQTQGVLAEINTQGETNLHNIVGAKTAFKWIQLLVGAYGLLPLVIGRWQAPAGLRKLFAAILPPVTLLPYFGLMFVWKLYRNFIQLSPQWEFRLSEYNEVLELVLALGLFLFMVFQLRKKRLDEFAG